MECGPTMPFYPAETITEQTLESGQTVRWSSAPLRDIWLALSGGGFRATAHHMGVLLAYLRHDMHFRLGIVNSVSGGAIAAGYFGYWLGDWTVSPDWNNRTGLTALRSFAQPLINLLRADVFWRGVRRRIGSMFRRDKAPSSPIAIEHLLTELLFSDAAAFAQKTFNAQAAALKLPATKARAREEPLVQWLGDGPVFVFTTVDVHMNLPFFVTSLGSGFSAYDVYRVAGHGRGTPIPLARSIAASAAFPLGFKPVSFELRGIEAELYQRKAESRHFADAFIPIRFEERERVALSLTDGGVVDNRGLAFFSDLARALFAHRLLDTMPKHGHIHAYDMGAAFALPEKPIRSYTKTLGRLALMASDTAQELHTQLLDERLRLLLAPAPELKLFSRDVFRAHQGLADEFEISPELLQHALTIRTHLDRFSDTEIAALVTIGYKLGVFGLIHAGLVDKSAMTRTNDELREILDGLLHPLPREQWLDHLQGSGNKFKIARAWKRWRLSRRHSPPETPPPASDETETTPA